MQVNPGCRAKRKRIAREILAVATRSAAEQKIPVSEDPGYSSWHTQNVFQEHPLAWITRNES
jgi:hypothetical protein